MNHSLAHLPAQKQRQLEEVTAIIVKAIDPEKVILFGSHATGKWVEDWYVEDLRKYTWNFSKELASVFPDDTPEEVYLFDLLKRGYVDARYKKDYKITADELQILIDRVAKLQKIAEKICKEKICKEKIEGLFK